MNRTTRSPGISSTSVAIQQKNKELERKLAEMERNSGSAGISSTSAAIQLKNKELERKLAEMERNSGSAGISSTSAAIQLKNKELERKLAEMERNSGSAGISSTSAAIQLKKKELERQLAEMERNSGSAGISSTSAAIQLKNKELERKLAEMERNSGSAGISSTSAAIQLKKKELERQLAEMERNSGSASISSTSAAIQLENKELERKLAEMERNSGSAGISSTSAAIQLKNKELERKLAEMERNSGSAGISSTSAAIQLKNKELEQKLADMERNARSPEMSSTSIAIRLRNEQLERKLVELEKGKSASGRVMSADSVAVHQKNQELERKLTDLERRKSASGRVMSTCSMALSERNAELERRFAGLFNSRSEGLSDSRQKKVNARVIELKRLIKASQELDLAFLVDVTGSMQQFIDSVKEKAPSIAAGVKKSWPELKLRVAFAPYRDYEETSRDDRETCDFTDDFSGGNSVFVKALSEVTAEGGGDQAEDVFSGLQRVASLSWKSRTRVLVHIGDAPCHGAEFYDEGVFDMYPEGDAKGRNISTLLNSLHDGCQIICYLFFHVNDTTKKMMSVFKKNCVNGNWIQEEKLSNIHKFADIVVNVSTASISQSLQVRDSSRVVPKVIPLIVNPEKPLWHSIRQEEAIQIRYKLPDSLDTLFHALDTNGRLEMEDMPDSRVQIAHNPFSGEGSLRWPYHAMVHQAPSAPRHMVVKRFKENFGQDVKQIHIKEAYYEQMEVQTVAAKMAQEFNIELERNVVDDYKTVQFTLVSSLRVGTRFYNMEKFLEGNWIRYSNNLNYVNTKEYAATLHAFSHWTYHRSKGLLVVNDLQGVEIMGTSGCKEFWLCDPAVHCKDALRYERTRTNWSTPGMKRFLEAHECNHICHALGLNST